MGSGGSPSERTPSPRSRLPRSGSCVRVLQLDREGNRGEDPRMSARLAFFAVLMLGAAASADENDVPGRAAIVMPPEVMGMYKDRGLIVSPFRYRSYFNECAQDAAASGGLRLKPVKWTSDMRWYAPDELGPFRQLTRMFDAALLVIPQVYVPAYQTNRYGLIASVYSRAKDQIVCRIEAACPRCDPQEVGELLFTIVRRAVLGAINGCEGDPNALVSLR
jgi:hypothetical protein